MEMDLPNLVATIDLFFLLNTLALASVPAAFIWIANRGEWENYGFLRCFLQALARSWLDTGLIAGILNSSILLMSQLAKNSQISVVEHELNALYFGVAQILGAFLAGGLATGAGFCLLDKNVRLKYQITPTFLGLSSKLPSALYAHFYIPPLVMNCYYRA